MVLVGLGSSSVCGIIGTGVGYFSVYVIVVLVGNGKLAFVSSDGLRTLRFGIVGLSRDKDVSLGATVIFLPVDGSLIITSTGTSDSITF